MKKTVLFCFILAVFFIQNAGAQELGGLYTEKKAGFTMSMPKDWQIMDLNQPFLMIIGPEDSGVNPNIGFGREDYKGSISEYIDVLIKLLPAYMSNFSYISRGSIKTTSKLDGEYFIFSCSEGELNIRMIMYVIQNKKKNAILLVTCAMPLNGEEKYDALYDACVKTLKWTK